MDGRETALAGLFEVSCLFGGTSFLGVAVKSTFFRLLDVSAAALSGMWYVSVVWTDFCLYSGSYGGLGSGRSCAWVLNLYIIPPKTP